MHKSQDAINILDLTPEEVYDKIKELGESKFRASQLLDWIYKKHIFNYDEMLNLSKKLRIKLSQELKLKLPKVVESYKSSDGSVKFLLSLRDNENIEMVLMPNEKTATLCISSQVGCARKCQFCATAQLGLTRNLETSEIVGQLLVVQKYLKYRKLSNVVFMGMGEPLDNFDNVIQALRIITHEQGLNLSSRKITVSTCGIIPNINKLAQSDVKVKLAVSLNAALDKKRDILMPVNQIYSLPELKKCLLDFRKKTAYRITFEYVLIKNFNMGIEDIIALNKFLGDQSCKLNLIAWNEVEGLDYKSPSEQDIEDFRASLDKLKCPIILRDSRGNDINAACGQLALKNKREE